MFGTGVCLHIIMYVMLLGIQWKSTGDTVHHFSLNCLLRPQKILHWVDVAPLDKRLGTPDLESYFLFDYFWNVEYNHLVSSHTQCVVLSGKAAMTTPNCSQLQADRSGTPVAQRPSSQQRDSNPGHASGSAVLTNWATSYSYKLCSVRLGAVVWVQLPI